MATLGNVHQMGIPGLEDFRPIGVGKKGKLEKAGEAAKPQGTQAPPKAPSTPSDSVQLSKEARESDSSGGGVLNLLKGLFD